MEPVRVLHVLGTLNLGGAESRVMDLYRNMNRKEIQFDFLIHDSEPQHYEEEVKSLGGRVYRLPRFKGYNYPVYKRAVKQFFKDHPEYLAVHGHMTSTASIYLPIAKGCGVGMTIAHARSAGVDPGLKGRLTTFLRRKLKEKTDYCFTCSGLAGEAVFGKRTMEEGRVQVLPNAIEAEKYRYNSSIREQIRKELKIEDKLVIGHVGRFSFMKNHGFLLQVFNQLVKRLADARLLLLGEGECMEEIKRKARDLGLEDRVLFLGNKRNVSDYYQAMDCFVFPSLFEGLPGTVVEAQAAGLPCFISDTITEEAVISPLVTRLSLQEAADQWAEQIEKTLLQSLPREDAISYIRAVGFDVKTQVDKMSVFYKTASKKKLMLMVPMLHQGGFERVCVLTARLLQPFFQVFICVFDLKDIAYDVEGIPVIHLNMGVKDGKVGKIYNVFKRSLAVSGIKRRLGIDVTYSFGPTANLVNVLSGGLRRKNSTTDRKGKIWCGIRSYMDMDSSNHRMLKLFVGGSDKIISCSKLIEEELREKYGCRNVETLYNPYDSKSILKQAEEEIADLPWNPEKVFTLVSMGRDDDVKGFWHLIKAFFLVAAKRQEARLLIIGDGEFTQYRRLAQELKVGDKVCFTGLKRNPYPYLKTGRIYLLTSYYEGFPNALVEAMTLSVPVIATDCKSGPGEILCREYQGKIWDGKPEERNNSVDKKDIWQEYGVLIPNLSREKSLDSTIIGEEEKELARIILALWTDQKKYDYYAMKAKERSGHFNHEAYVEQISRMLEESHISFERE